MLMNWILTLILTGCMATPTSYRMPVVEPMLLGNSDRDYAVCIRSVMLMYVKAQTVPNVKFVTAHCEQVRRSFQERQPASDEI